MRLRSVLVCSVLSATIAGIGFAQAAGSSSGLKIIPAAEILDVFAQLPVRSGSAPRTPVGVPHQQQNQNAPAALQRALQEAAAELPGIRFEPTPFSLAGSVGWRLEEEFANGPTGAFISNTPEFAHQHVVSDGSLHMLLPSHVAQSALEKRWGVAHPWSDGLSGENSDYVMIFGPRNPDELGSVWIIALISYYQARGLRMEQSN